TSLDVKTLKNKTHFTVSDVSLDGVGKRITGDLYDTDFKFVVDKIGIIGSDGERIDVAGLHYIVDTDTKGDFVEMAAKVGTGEIKSKQLSAYGVELKEIHYDLSVRRLH